MILWGSRKITSHRWAPQWADGLFFRIENVQIDHPHHGEGIFFTAHVL